MADATASALDRLLALLPPGQHDLTRELLRVLWVPPDLRYFYAGVSRLSSLMHAYESDFDAKLTALLPQESLHAWLGVIQGLAMRRADKTLLDTIVASPATAQGDGKKHFMFGYLTAFPTYSALLTARDAADPLRRGHDRVSALFLSHAMAHQMEVEWSLYTEFLDSWNAYQRRADKYNVQRPTLPLQHASSLFNASVLIRDLFENDPVALLNALAEVEGPEEIDVVRAEFRDISQASGLRNEEVLHAHLRQFASFLMERYRGQAEKTTPPSPSGPTSRTEVLRPGTRLRRGTHLTVDFSLEDQEDTETLVVRPLPSAEELRLAVVLGLPPEELVEPPALATFALEDEDQAPDGAALRAFTQNELQWRRRANQFQRWSADYVNADTRLHAITWLREEMNKPTDSATDIAILASVIARLLILTSLATGRPAKNLVQEMAPVQTFTVEAGEGANVLYELTSRSLWLRVGRADTEAVAVHGARPVHDFLQLPDFLQLAGGMQLWCDHKSRLSAETLNAAIDAVHQQLQKAFGIRAAQWWTLLPWTLLQITGNFSTAALLTAWRPLNAAVDLHYLSPAAQPVARRYQAAMHALLGMLDDPRIRPGSISLPPPQGWVGMPNTPEWSHLRSLIEMLAHAAGEPNRTRAERHNLMVHYTIMMVTFALGIRHTVDVHPKCLELDAFTVAHFREKADDRFLIVPPRLVEQLRHYDRHRAVVCSWTGMRDRLAELDNPLFFLLDADEAPAQFHPTKFGDYLAAFGIRFELPLNSLRRLVFTALFEAGLRGIVLDTYIGHAAHGREAFVTGSGVDLAPLIELSEEIDILLRKHGWQLLPGLDHG